MKLKQQTRALNSLCMKNGFVNPKNKTHVHLIANCQTFMMGSLSSVTQGELRHIDTIAQMYYQLNKPTLESEKIVLRPVPFVGGKANHEVQ